MQLGAGMRVLCSSVLASLAALASLVAPSHAQPSAPSPTIDTPATPAPETEDRTIRFALGVSSPLGWKHLESFGASAYVGLGNHHALRATVSRDHPEDLLTVVATGFEGVPYYGRVLDAGLGLVWYPDRMWDGLTLELGALLRQRDVVSAGEFAPSITTETVTYAGRGMVGWSWRVAGPLFIAIAGGISMGYESGVETIEPELGMATTNRVARLQVDGEAYLRIGLAFGR